MVTDVVCTSAEDVAGAAACHSSYIGEIGPGEEEEHCNNTGKDFVWNAKADEFSPMFEDSECFLRIGICCVLAPVPQKRAD